VKIGSPSRLTREALPDLPSGEWPDLLLQHINSNNEEKTQALQNNITIGDNMNAAIMVQRMTHGVERTIKNPLKGRPVTIHAGRSIAINGGTRHRVADVDWRFIDNPDPTAPQQLGITVRYAPATIGEAVRSFVAQGSAVALTNNIPANVTTISLTAGDWDVSGICVIQGTLTGTYVVGSINTTSATRGTSGDNDVFSPTMPTAISGVCLVIPNYRLSLTATTTVYLVAQAGFTAGTASAFGRLSATRVGVAASTQNDIAFVVYGG
jgi:hypothetical protein